MKVYRKDKKLKRKRNWKKWRKIKDISDNYLKQQKNREAIGLLSQRAPVEFTKRKKYLNENEEKVIKIEKQEKERVIKKFETMKWSKKFLLRVLYFLKLLKLWMKKIKLNTLII